jgi:alpha-L-arabinofuranosidase
MKVSGHFKRSLIIAVCAVLFLSFSTVFAEQAKITVRADQSGNRISPLLYGIFFEEINRAGDGGIYAEMVRNRSFEDANKPVAWSLVEGANSKAVISLDNSKPLNEKNPHCLKFQVSSFTQGIAAVTNEGFKGMSFKKGQNYELSLYARADANYTGQLKVELIDEKGQSLSAQNTDRLTAEWKQYHLTMTALSDCAAGKLRIGATNEGTFFLDIVSLFPKNTWKGRSNGLRSDLAEMLLAMKPSFVRFPGGCFVEGNKIANAFRWKKSIGDIAQRPGHWNLWGYLSTDGLGYHEYLQMCEDLKAEALFVINCGIAHEDTIPMDQMGEWVQDALDAIEYANGPAGSQWGSLRAKNGHPEPFGLKYIEIGNENGGPLYQERYNLFYDAIKKKYPDMKIVADVPTTDRPTEIVDEHYYSNPEFFIANADRYDNYDRKGPKIYVGEYAVTQNCGHGNLRAAVGEAAFMTGMERNSDIVVMASYAPLFVNVNWRRWNPDAINFDSSRCCGTPSFYVQKMFSEARGDVFVPIELQTPSVEPESAKKGGQLGLGTWATQAEFKDIRILQDNKEVFRSDFSHNINGWRVVSGDWQIVDGAIRQNSTENDRRIMIKDLVLNDCTIELKARKIGGAEGFLILFRAPNDQTKSWLDIGGWGNTQHAVEIGGIVGKALPGKVETGRWYDIRIELAGNSIRCFLDNNLIFDLKLPKQKSLYAVASRSEKSGELILKVVNVTDQPIETQVNLQGLKNTPASAAANVLTAQVADAENSLDEPKKVYPAAQTINLSGTSFVHTFPAQSVTVLRFQTKNPK